MQSRAMYAEPRAPAARNERVLHPSQQMTNKRGAIHTPLSPHCVCAAFTQRARTQKRRFVSLCVSDRYIPIARKWPRFYERPRRKRRRNQQKQSRLKFYSARKRISLLLLFALSLCAPHCSSGTKAEAGAQILARRGALDWKLQRAGVLDKSC
jgi:hypothetical protein